MYYVKSNYHFVVCLCMYRAAADMLYLQVSLCRWGAIGLLALPFGFADGVPASDLVLISGSGRESHTGRQGSTCREVLWWGRI